MKKVMIGVGVFFVVCIALLLIVPLVLPVSVYKDRVIALVEAQTGRTLAVNGPVSLSLIPEISLTLEKATFSDIPGRSEPMIEVPKLSVSLGLFPLLSGVIDIRGIEAEGPTIRLSRDSSGRGNWEFTPPTGQNAPSEEAAPSQETPPAEVSRRNALAIHMVNIRSGRIFIDDAVTATTWSFEDINLSLQQGGESAPLITESTFVWNGEKTSLTLNASQPFDLLNNGSSDVDLTFVSSPISFALKGNVDAAVVRDILVHRGADQTSAETSVQEISITLSIPSVEKLTQWLGNDMPTAITGLEKISFQAVLGVTNRQIVLGSMRTDLNGMLINGAAGIRFGVEQPKIVASLETGTLDLASIQAMLGAAASTSSSDAAKATATVPAATATGLAADPWFFLKTADADVSLEIASITAAGFVVQKPRLTAMLAAQTLTVDVPAFFFGLQGSEAKNSTSLSLVLKVDGKEAVASGSMMLRSSLAPFADMAAQKGLQGELDTQLTFSGVASSPENLVQTLKAKGPFSLTALSLPSAGIKAASIKGVLESNGLSFMLMGMEAALDNLKASGSIGGSLKGKKPLITGQVAFGAVDVRPFLANSAVKSEGRGATPVKKSSGTWSSEPIDLSALTLVDAKVGLSAGPVITDQVRLEKVAMAVDLVDGRLGVTVSEAQLYGGQGKARLNLDSQQKSPAWAGTVQLNGLQLEPLLGALANFRTLTGSLSVTADLTSRGRSLADLMGALAGKGSMRVDNGLIRGIDLARIARNVVSAVTGGDQPSGQTAFSRVSASFTAQQGRINNPDLRIESPVLLLTGAGQINIPAQTLSYRLTPQKIPALGSGQNPLQNLLFPVLISGPWSNLSFAPDLKAALPDPGRVVERLRDAAPKLPDVSSRRGRQDLLRGVLGR